MLNVVIGYDRENRIPAYTCAESIMQNASVPVAFTFLHRDMLKQYKRKRGEFESTEFSNSRFLTPSLFDFKGWTLFMDNDMICKADIAELFGMADERYSVMCVKHNQIVNGPTKFGGHRQESYSFKNWSSLMLFNNAKCQALTVDYVNTAHGLDLHQFRWLGDLDLIGSLPLEWNYLVDNRNQSVAAPKIIHYTDGGPYFKEYDSCGYSEDYKAIYSLINDYQRG